MRDGLVGQGAEGLKDRIRELEAIKVEAKADADRAEAAIEKLGPMITPESIERMATAAREGLRDADGKYRRAHVRSARRGAVHGRDQDHGRSNRTASHHGRLGRRALRACRSSQF
ncbi:hypothetical protein ASD21_11630 [Caulobacter sp. Root1455]|nr:hypothetical protein ASD21_11630 [Caulobacter sp. Root1455]